MADEFSTAAVCGGGWWNPTRSMFGSSLCTADWGQALMQDNERGDRDYGSMLQEDLNYGEESSNAAGDFSLGHQTLTSSQGLSTSFPITSYNYPPSLLKSMFDADGYAVSYAPPPATTNYGPDLSDLPPSPPKFSSLLTPTNHHLQFPSTISLWNSSATASLNDVRPCFFPSPTFADKKSVIAAKSNGSNKEVRDSSCVANKTSTEPDFKRRRLETPSPLPTFKVRKEKLGDRITALQQLVSPFGKTDTASVLHEAIENIKLLHDQVNGLLTDYMKKGSPSHQPGQRNVEEVLEEEEGVWRQDLRSRGLCVVPMSSTFPVAAETATDFWTPMFEQISSRNYCKRTRLN